MKRTILAAILAATVVSPAQAWTYDTWNGSGMSMNHRYYGWALGGGRGDAYIEAPAVTEAERQKAIAQQRECKPVVMWTDAGRVTYPALGCRP